MPQDRVGHRAMKSISTEILICVPAEVTDDYGTEDKKDIHGDGPCEGDFEDQVEQRQQGNTASGSKRSEDQIL